MNRLLFACIGVAATGVLLALLGPAIGLGSAYSFILYRWFGLSRHELLLASGLALAALIAVWVIRAFFLPTLHRLYLAILSIAFLLPPLHSLYLAVLSIVFIPYYLSHSFERPTWAIISLVAMPIGAAIGGWIARAKRRVELAQTWAVAVWSALFAFFASDMFLKARASIQETHVQRILRERLRDPTALPAIFPRVLVGDSNPPGSFALKDSAGLDFVPLADVSRSLAVYCKEIGAYTIYRSDEKGYHNPEGIWSEPADIAVIGDSYVHGACVPSGSDYVSLIRQTFPQSLNLGRGGNGPLSELAILSEYAAPAMPRLVLWLYVANDFRDLDAERKSPILMGYLLSEHIRHLSVRTDEIDGIVRNYLETELRRQDQSLAPSWRTALWTRLTPANAMESLAFPEVRDQVLRPHYGNHDAQVTPNDFEFPDHDWPLLKQILETARRRIRSWGGELAVLIVPFEDGHGFVDPDKYPPAGNYRDHLQGIFQELGLPYHDLNDDFRQLRNPNLYLADLHGFYGHENPAGYAVMADATVRLISSICRTANKRVLICRPG